MPNLKSLLFNYKHPLLGLTLFFLILATHLGEDNPFTRGFLFLHFGFFLLWQPVIKQNFSFDKVTVFFLSITILYFIIFFNPWLNALWFLLLLTLLSGHIFARGLTRAVYGYAVIILFFEFSLIITPELFKLIATSSSFIIPLKIILTGLPLFLLFSPTTKDYSKKIDFIRGFLIVFLAVFLCMSSALISLTTQQTYIFSLAISAFILSLFLLLATYLWKPRAEFSGLGVLLEKYLLNIGGPFEQWMNNIITLETNTKLQPLEALTSNIRYLVTQHWVSGIRWSTTTKNGLEGKTSEYDIEIIDRNITLTLYAYTPIGAALRLHGKLLLGVLIFYYQAKTQEKKLIQQAHLQAIYETGSKLTHDIKNILQTTQIMAQIVNNKTMNQTETLDILTKQIPLLNQRLNTSLEKLYASDEFSNHHPLNSGSLLQWWVNIKTPYANHIVFINEITDDCEIPLDIFTNSLENLLANAKNKRLTEPKIAITVTLKVINNLLTLSVCDTGSCIEQHTASVLFKEVVSSQNGFGIGLYQANILALSQGYQLSLNHNEKNHVCFILQKVKLS